MKAILPYLATAILFYLIGWFHCRSMTASHLRSLNRKLHEQNEKLAKAITENK